MEEKEKQKGVGTVEKRRTRDLRVVEEQPDVSRQLCHLGPWWYLPMMPLGTTSESMSLQQQRLVNQKARKMSVVWADVWGLYRTDPILHLGILGKLALPLISCVV